MGDGGASRTGPRSAGLARGGRHALGQLGRPTRSTDADDRIDLNHADRAQLLQLPHVGEVTAEHIEEYRQSHNGFRSVDELQSVCAASVPPCWNNSGRWSRPARTRRRRTASDSPRRSAPHRRLVRSPRRKPTSPRLGRPRPSGKRATARPSRSTSTPLRPRNWSDCRTSAPPYPPGSSSSASNGHFSPWTNAPRQGHRPEDPGRTEAVREGEVTAHCRSRLYRRPGPRYDSLRRRRP